MKIGEFRNGDLVRVAAEYVAPSYEGFKPEGLLGVVIDDIDANEEVKIMYAGCILTGWWNVDQLELLERPE